ncbi:MAG: NifU N-terminal domain-containing protein [Phycisphaerales bacterium]|nr:NifU N-terminal domain-containing protein [Phycisphaerales bacterium]
MPYRVTKFLSTPNPNALKCELDRSPAPDRPRAYSQGDQVQDDPLASSLLAIPGVAHLLIHDGWITVGKVTDASWSGLKPRITRVLGDAP